MTASLTSDDPLALLDDALALLERDGWSSRGGRGPDGSRCVAVALSDAAYDGGYTRRANDAAFRRVRHAVYEAVMAIPDERALMLATIPHWNDYLAQDFSDVRTIFKHAHDEDLP